MAKKSPLQYTAEEMAEYVASVREAVALFIKESPIVPKFADLVAYMNTKFNAVDEEMFKQWTEKEFPGQIAYSHVLSATYPDEADDVVED